jgi:hypothetical protein
MLKFLAYVIALSAFIGCSASADDLNTHLMNSTFEIIGPSAQKPGQQTLGTVFFMGKPTEGNPTQANYVLITAAHVLDRIAGDTALLVLRRKRADGMYAKLPFPIPIRANGKNLYMKNPTADVVAMFAALPSDADISLLPITLLADDTTLKQLEIHPGDALMCLGFPLNIDENGFPVIRSGVLASYPITPADTVKQYYYNFHVFPGNSGGPIYFSFENRIFDGSTHIGVQQGVIGLVSEAVGSAMPQFKDMPMDISVVVPGFYIRQTIDMLPKPPQ